MLTIAEPVTAADHEVMEVPAGAMSLTPAPVTSVGPLLVTTIVYVTSVGGANTVKPSSLVIAKSARLCCVFVSDALLLLRS